MWHYYFLAYVLVLLFSKASEDLMVFIFVFLLFWFLNDLLPSAFLYLLFFLFCYFSFIVSFLHSSSDSWLSVCVCEWWVRLLFLGKWFWFSCYLFFINLLETCVHGCCSLTSQFIGWALREPVFKQGVFQNARSEQVLLSDTNIFSFPTPPLLPISLRNFLWFL